MTGRDQGRVEAAARAIRPTSFARADAGWPATGNEFEDRSRRYSDLNAIKLARKHAAWAIEAADAADPCVRVPEEPTPEMVEAVARKLFVIRYCQPDSDIRRIFFGADISWEQLVNGEATGNYVSGTVQDVRQQADTLIRAMLAAFRSQDEGGR